MAERVGTTLDKETARKHVNIFDFLGDLGFEERVGQEELRKGRD